MSAPAAVPWMAPFPWRSRACWKRSVPYSRKIAAYGNFDVATVGILPGRDVDPDRICWSSDGLDESAAHGLQHPERGWFRDSRLRRLSSLPTRLRHPRSDVD